MTDTKPAAASSRRPSNVSTALAADRLGVPAVVFFVMSAATPLTVVAGVVTTGYAVTGITGLPVAFVVIGAILALFCVGYVSMARRVANGWVGRAARFQRGLVLFRAASRRTGRDGFPIIRLSSDYDVSGATVGPLWM